MTSPDKPWWKPLTGSPDWMAIDKPWYGWAFASAALLLFLLLVLIAPKQVVAGPMAAASISALFQAIRVRKGGHQ